MESKRSVSRIWRLKDDKLTSSDEAHRTPFEKHVQDSQWIFQYFSQKNENEIYKLFFGNIAKKIFLSKLDRDKNNPYQGLNFNYITSLFQKQNYITRDEKETYFMTLPSEKLLLISPIKFCMMKYCPKAKCDLQICYTIFLQTEPMCHHEGILFYIIHKGIL